MRSILFLLSLAAFAVAMPFNEPSVAREEAARAVPVPGAFIEGFGVTQNTKNFGRDEVADRAIPVPGAFIEGFGVTQETKEFAGRAIPVPGAFIEGFGVTQNTEEFQ